MKKIPTENFLTRQRELYHPSVFEENLDDSHPFPDFNKAAFSWIAPEYLQHPKTVKWWVIAGIVILLAVVAEAFSGNWTMLAATLVFAAVYAYMHQAHPPRHTKINISELGIKIGHRKIPYESLEAFWIIYDPPLTKRLYFRQKNQLISDLIIELDDQDPIAIRAFLEKYLVEITGVQEQFSDVLLRLLKL